MAHSDSDPQVLGRKLLVQTVIGAIVFAAAAYFLVS